MPGRKPLYERLSYNRDASTIRRMLTETNVAATDRRAIFVGAEAYTEVGGTILRDLFTEDRGGYFEDVALLDMLVVAKLGREADALMEAEGWKWAQVYPRLPAQPRAAPDLSASSGTVGGRSGRLGCRAGRVRRPDGAT